MFFDIRSRRGLGVSVDVTVDVTQVRNVANSWPKRPAARERNSTISNAPRPEPRTHTYFRAQLCVPISMPFAGIGPEVTRMGGPE